MLKMFSKSVPLMPLVVSIGKLLFGIISVLFPSFARILINSYEEDSKLYIDGSYILFHHSGRSLGNVNYCIVPLIQDLTDFEVSQMWYADDASVGGSLMSLPS